MSSSNSQMTKKSKKPFERYIYKTIIWIFILCFLGFFTLGNQYMFLKFNHHPTTVVLSTIMLELAAELRDINTTGVAAFSTETDTKQGESSSANLDHLCSGRYVYMYDLPSRFNEDILRNCSTLDKFDGDLCPYVSGMGLGPLASNSEGILQDRGWYSTHQFVLEIIFHHKMKHYECLTKNSSLASAIFVPFYAGLDVGPLLWDYNNPAKDAVSIELANWLASRPEMKYMNGQDHFLVAGRVAWDFRRPWEHESWGNKLMLLTIESTYGGNDFAIPYPTFFHPLSTNQVLSWQKNVLDANRHYLFSFLGAPRPKKELSIRGEIISQCLNSSSYSFLDCSNRTVVDCYDPATTMRVLKNSTFCLQHPGDTSTRRSIFDSIVAGCIPVFFNMHSAFYQYRWHLPMDDHTQFSVYIPEESVRDEKLSIEKILLGFSESEIMEMRDKVTRVIPNVIYSDPRSKLDGVEDAFDITVARVLERVEKMRKGAAAA